MKRLEPRTVAFREEEVGVTKSDFGVYRSFWLTYTRGNKKDKKNRRSAGAEEKRPWNCCSWLLGSKI